MHRCWALLGILFTIPCLQLDGHPPPLVFLPVVLGAWLLGHLYLKVLRRLALRGVVRAKGLRPESRGWPYPIRCLLGLFSVVTAFLLFRVMILIPGLGFGFGLPEPQILLFWTLHPVLLYAVLMRYPWSRWASVPVLFVWAGILGCEALYALVRAGYADWIVWLAAAVPSLLVFSWSRSLIRSGRVRDFFC